MYYLHFSTVNCLSPKLGNAVNQSFLRSWFHSCSQMMLEFMPHQFNRVEVWTLVVFSTNLHLRPRRMILLGCSYASDRWPFGKCIEMNGSNVFLKIVSTKNTASMHPVNMAIPVAPRFEMPAKTCTLYGCFGTPFCYGRSHQ